MFGRQIYLTNTSLLMPTIEAKGRYTKPENF